MDPGDFKARTKAFALRVIRLAEKLADRWNNAIAVPGYSDLRREQ